MTKVNEVNEVNEVAEYLVNCPGLKLSIKSLSKRLNMKRRYVTYLAYNSSSVRKINPMEVGSLRTSITVFTAI